MCIMIRTLGMLVSCLGVFHVAPKPEVVEDEAKYQQICEMLRRSSAEHSREAHNFAKRLWFRTVHCGPLEVAALLS